jgi:hypothetical protein
MVDRAVLGAGILSISISLATYITDCSTFITTYHQGLVQVAK